MKTKTYKNIPIEITKNKNAVTEVQKYEARFLIHKMSHRALGATEEEAFEEAQKSINIFGLEDEDTINN